jgi:hypothetical protein
MKVLYMEKVENELLALKYAYAFMTSTYLYKKECSFMNLNPTQFDGIHVCPRDSVSVFYEESNLPSWDSFKTTSEHTSMFSCIGAIDELDKYRLNCSLINGSIIFICYGDYEKLAKKAIESIIRNHNRLN